MTAIENAPVEAVCWDWNGTLLDDVEIARAAMNAVLRERSLPLIPDQDAYRRVFGFPIRSFYARLGLSDTDFLGAADHYLRLFADTVGGAPLHADARATLATIRERGVEQIVISATPAATLEKQLAPHALDEHFTQIHGITDPYAASKSHVVESWLSSSGRDPRRVLMIGDTNHDEEIADALGVRFLRFQNGHQEAPDHDRHPVVSRLREVPGHLGTASSGR